MFIYIIASIAISLLSAALAPKPDGPQHAKPGKFEGPAPAAGEPVTVAWGTVWEKSPKVVFYGNPKKVPIWSGGGGKK